MVWSSVRIWWPHLATLAEAHFKSNLCTKWDTHLRNKVLLSLRWASRSFTVTAACRIIITAQHTLKLGTFSPFSSTMLKNPNITCSWNSCCTKKMTASSLTCIAFKRLLRDQKIFVWFSKRHISVCLVYDDVRMLDWYENSRLATKELKSYYASFVAWFNFMLLLAYNTYFYSTIALKCTFAIWIGHGSSCLNQHNFWIYPTRMWTTDLLAAQK